MANLVDSMNNEKNLDYWTHWTMMSVQGARRHFHLWILKMSFKPKMIFHISIAYITFEHKSLENTQYNIIISQNISNLFSDKYIHNNKICYLFSCIKQILKSYRI